MLLTCLKLEIHLFQENFTYLDWIICSAWSWKPLTQHDSPSYDEAIGSSQTVSWRCRCSISCIFHLQGAPHRRDSRFQRSSVNSADNPMLGQAPSAAYFYVWKRIMRGLFRRRSDSIRFWVHFEGQWTFQLFLSSIFRWSLCWWITSHEELRTWVHLSADDMIPHSMKERIGVNRMELAMKRRVRRRRWQRGSAMNQISFLTRREPSVSLTASVWLWACKWRS